MAYPPAVPPATRTDATVMSSNHPADHNAISGALTDILTHMATMDQKLTDLYNRLASVVVYARTVQVATDPGGNVFIAFPPGWFPGNPAVVASGADPSIQVQISTYGASPAGVYLQVRSPSGVPLGVVVYVGYIAVWGDVH